jgi:hypothetical protein
MWARDGRYGARVRRAALGLVLPAALAAAGCGDESRFTAEEFVRDVNREGVKLRLGEPLTTDEEGKELYAISLEPLQGPRVDSHGEAILTEGSISAYDENEGEPDDEFRTCQQAVDLLCYRLANVVIVLEGGGLEAQQLGVAIKRLSGE